METLRLKARDAIQSYFGRSEKFTVNDVVDVTCDLADVVFEALGISEDKQDIEGAEVVVNGLRYVNNMGKSKVPEIVITVEGGLIQNVKIPKGHKVRVKVQDFDIEGCEDDEITTSSDGKEYVESVWEN